MIVPAVPAVNVAGQDMVEALGIVVSVILRVPVLTVPLFVPEVNVALADAEPLPSELCVIVLPALAKYLPLCCLAKLAEKLYELPDI